VRTSAWRVPVAVTQVYLSIEVDLPADEVTKALGIRPSASRRYRNLLLERDLTQWKLELAAGPVTYQVVQEAADRLLAFGESLATRMSTVREQSGGAIALVIAQVITDDPRSTGIDLPPALLRWLADAGASVAIDQHV
jgi:hypothetical protein